MARGAETGETTSRSPDRARAEALLPGIGGVDLPDDRVVLGILVKPWGTRGEQTAKLHNPASDLLEQMDAVFVRGSDFPARQVPLQRARWVGKRFVVHLAGVDNPEDAAVLRGLELFVDAADLPALDEDEYYVRDLLGMEVVDEDGASVGELADVFATGSNDVYVVRGPGGEMLIPAVPDFVLDVNLQQRRIRVRRVEF